MKAVVVDQFMLPSELRVREAPEPSVVAGEVLVDVKAAGCNFADTLVVQGKYQEKPPFPFSPGSEIAGVVRQLGPGVTGFRPGERVCAYVKHGGFAAQIAVPVDAMHPIPDGMGFEQAAAFPIAYGMSYAAVVQRGRTQPGETLVVTAAAGGVGVAAVQIGKAVGARVIGLASGDKLDVVTAAGADVVIDYRAEDWTEVLARETGSEGINVVVENVGGEVFDACVRRMAWDGRLVVVGFASGKIPELRINRVLLKHIAVVGLFWGLTHQHELHTVRSAFRALASLHRQGKIAPLVWKSFPLENVADALGLLGGRQSVGKIVLTI